MFDLNWGLNVFWVQDLQKTTPLQNFHDYFCFVILCRNNQKNLTAFILDIKFSFKRKNILAWLSNWLILLENCVNLKNIVTINKRYFKIDQHLARHFRCYGACLSMQSNSYSPFINSIRKQGCNLANCGILITLF